MKYLKFICVIGVTNCVLLFVIMNLATGQQKTLHGKFYAWFEAERHTKNDSLQKMSDATASGGSYVWTPDGTAIYEFEIKRAGIYKVWGRVIALDGRGDSFAVSMDNEKSFKWNGIPHDVAWHWDDVHDAMKENKTVEFNLAIGTHVLRFKPRDDDNARLDCLIVTDDLNFTPSNAMTKKQIGNNTPPQGDAVYLRLEAESGKIQAPFVTARDATASNGSYVWMPDADAAYEFVVTEAGNYKVWGRVLAPNGSDDSFGVNMDNGKWIKWNNIAHGETWLWDEVHDSENADRVMQFNLSPGKHTLRFLQREDRTKLDCLLVTNDMNYTPTGAIPTSQSNQNK